MSYNAINAIFYNLYKPHVIVLLLKIPDACGWIDHKNLLGNHKTATNQSNKPLWIYVDYTVIERNRKFSIAVKFYRI